MKIIAWNINGLRSLLKTENLDNLIKSEKPDILCFGETKLSCPYTTIDDTMKDRYKEYKYRYWSHCEKKGGYSGTAILTKKKPLNIMYGLKYHDKELDDEGRVITIEYNKYYLLHVYTPNSGQALARLKFRTKIWDIAFSHHIEKLQKSKPVIVCGDLNVAHKEIDLKNPKTNKMTAGFTDDERESFTNLLNNNKLIDTFRFINKDLIKYSFWSYMRKSREKNIGWRIDYFLTSDIMQKNIQDSDIITTIHGSDHAPIKLVLKI
jgi:exodeoxyribonuclease-3